MKNKLLSLVLVIGIAGCASGKSERERKEAAQRRQQQEQAQKQEKQAKLEAEKKAQQEAQEIKQRAELGQPQVSESDTMIVSEREVTRTVKERTELPTIRVTEEKADLNRMTAQHFVALGVSEELASNIVDYRDTHGKFDSVNQLMEVPGMSRAEFNSIKDQVIAQPVG